jgi:hypothetical protein
MTMPARATRSAFFEERTFLAFAIFKRIELTFDSVGSLSPFTWEVIPILGMNGELSM